MCIYWNIYSLFVFAPVSSFLASTRRSLNSLVSVFYDPYGKVELVIFEVPPHSSSISVNLQCLTDHLI